jgi:hypothetical protein
VARAGRWGRWRAAWGWPPPAPALAPAWQLLPGSAAPQRPAWMRAGRRRCWRRAAPARRRWGWCPCRQGVRGSLRQLRRRQCPPCLGVGTAAPLQRLSSSPAAGARVAAGRGRGQAGAHLGETPPPPEALGLADARGVLAGSSQLGARKNVAWNRWSKKGVCGGRRPAARQRPARRRPPARPPSLRAGRQPTLM